MTASFFDVSRAMRAVRVLSAALVVVTCGGIVACGGDGGSGVNDVKKACQIRASWTRAQSDACSTCQISAYTSRDCDCKKDEYRGLCNEEIVARNAEPDCVYEIDACVNACKSDCECVDACYANHTTCKPVQAAYDGCLADVCNDACK